MCIFFFFRNSLQTGRTAGSVASYVGEAGCTGAGIDSLPNAGGSDDVGYSGLLRHRAQAHGFEHDPEEAGLGPVFRPVGVRGRRVAHVRQRVAVQPEDVPRLSVLHEGEFFRVAEVVECRYLMREMFVLLSNAAVGSVRARN